MPMEKLKVGNKLVWFDLKHQSIIDAFPVFRLFEKTLLDVGTGRAQVPRVLGRGGWDVDCVDIKRRDCWKHDEHVNFIEGDFLTSKELREEYSVVMASEVLEHLPNYKQFLEKMIALATARVIITVPFENSFDVPGPPPEGHCNYWSWQPVEGVLESDGKSEVVWQARSITEFVDLCAPYSVSVSTIRTKPEDLGTGAACFLIIIDKRQRQRGMDM